MYQTKVNLRQCYKNIWIINLKILNKLHDEILKDRNIQFSLTPEWIKFNDSIDIYNLPKNRIIIPFIIKIIS